MFESLNGVTEQVVFPRVLEYEISNTLKIRCRLNNYRIIKYWMTKKNLNIIRQS